METNKIYLICVGGFIEPPMDWYNSLKKEYFTDSYEGILEGKYYKPSEEQIAFNLANPGLDAYGAFYMIAPTTEELNEEIRKQRQKLYVANTDKLYMAYVRYKEFGEEEKAQKAYKEWKSAVQNIDVTTPYIV